MTRAPSLAIFTVTPHRYGGGAEQFNERLCAAARARGWEANIVTPPSWQFKFVVGALGLGYRFRHLSWSGDSSGSAAALRTAHYIYVKNEPLDLLWLAAFRARGARTIGFHTPVRYPGDTLAIRLRNRVYASELYSRMLRNARLHLLSVHDAALLPESARAQAMRIIPNGVPMSLSIPGPRDTRPKGPLRLLFVGRLTPQKGLDRLIEPLARDHQASGLTVIGDGPMRGALERSFGEHARFLGRLSREEVLTAMRNHDVLLMPSRWESSPFVLLEAMAAGCVPVVSGIAPLTGTLPPELRWLATDFDGSLSDVLIRLARLKKNGDWEALRERLREHVRREYDEEQNFDALLAFIDAAEVN